MKIEFVEYIKVYGEKFDGIAVVNFDDIIHLRYKVVPGKEGKGRFFAIPSVKVAEGEYKNSWTIGNNFHVEAIESCIKNGLKKFYDEDLPF